MVGCLLAGISVETVIGFQHGEADPALLRRDLTAMLRGALAG